MLEKAPGLILRLFTSIRAFMVKQYCMKLMGPDPNPLVEGLAEAALIALVPRRYSVQFACAKTS